MTESSQDLGSELLALEEAASVRRLCSLATKVADLDDETRETALRLAKDKRISLRSLSTALGKHGIRVAKDTISAHRNESCRCYE
jgi:hypothetical protein